MTAVVVKPADRAAEHARLIALAETIWREHYPGIISHAQIDYMLAHDYNADTLAAQQRAGTRFLLAYQNDTAIGLAALSPVDEHRRAWLDKLYVHKDAHISALDSM